MTAIEQYEPERAALPDPTGGRLVAWARAASAANALAKSLCQTTFAPKVFRDNPGDATAAIVLGDELGLTPLTALRSIYVIAGTPALYTRAMVALAQSRGHRIWTTEDTVTRVTVCGQRRGETHVETVTWTIERARTAGHTSNAQWQKNPQNMLWARAAGDVARRIAADVLAGVPYSVEELSDAEPASTTTVTRAEPAASRKVARKPRALAPVPAPEEPGFDEPAPSAPAESAEPGPDVATPAQIQKLAIVMGEKGITEREARLDWLSGRLDREVMSSKDLTRSEAARCIDALENGDPPVEDPPGWGDEPA